MFPGQAETAEGFVSLILGWIYPCDFDCLEPLFSLLDLKLDRLSLLETLIAFTDDRLEVDKQVLATLPFDKTVALSVVEPLHSTPFHNSATFQYG